MSARRYYLRARRTAALIADPSLASAYQAKQLAEPGTPLAPDFPFLSRLNAAGYLALEDFGLDVPNRVDVNELVREAGLSPYEARAVMVALGVPP